MMRQDEPGALPVSEAVFHEGQVQIRITTVKFVAHDGMPKVCKMDSNLMFAAGQRVKADEGKWSP
jgi:hypothetical protein